MVMRSSIPTADMSSEKASAVGIMWGNEVVRSESASISKKIAPEIWLATYRAKVSTGGVIPTGGRVASRTTVRGSSRRPANQEVGTRGFMEYAYFVPGPKEAPIELAY